MLALPTQHSAWENSISIILFQQSAPVCPAQMKMIKCPDGSEICKHQAFIWMAGWVLVCLETSLFLSGRTECWTEPPPPQPPITLHYILSWAAPDINYAKSLELFFFFFIVATLLLIVAVDGRSSWSFWLSTSSSDKVMVRKHFTPVWLADRLTGTF